jgi:formylglycine-generating enzyme required for sulfatase activity
MNRTIRFLLGALVFATCVHSATSQITNLEMTTVEGQTILFLPPSSTNYILQSTTNLTTSNWVPVTDGFAVTAMAFSNQYPARFFRLYNPQSSATYGMVQIPGGTFTMGDSLDGESDATPTVSATISPFYMDTNLVSVAQWQAVFTYATNHGYSFVNSGQGNGTNLNMPVQTVDWFDCLKWCNARSQQAGLTPVYYTDSGFTTAYTTGEPGAVYANFAALGYRLPTEAEWEYAARGGLTGMRFPLGNTISESQANYYSTPGGYVYDSGPNGYNIYYASGSPSLNTSVVGLFPPNGYGLCDMAGNVLEWCFDWYSTPYPGGSDPVNPAPPSGNNRVLRGGYWNSDAYGVRCARRWSADPTFSANAAGFRCVGKL